MNPIRKPIYLVAALVFAGAMVAAEDDPFVGTWNLDLAKSTYSSNDPKPKNLTVNAVREGENVVVTFNGTAQDGSPIKTQFTAPIKGGPVTGLGQSPSWDTTVLQYISPTAHDFVYSKDGKEVARRHIKMAEDHKTFTARFTSPDPQGKIITQNDFWRRQ